MTKKPLILMTNDDGIESEGLKQVWKALQFDADLVIVAPSIEQSFISLATTRRSPLQIKKANWPETNHAWHLNGTPVDCVKLALHTILPRKPDLIISGLNRGDNLGSTVLYSGTVAAAIEGMLSGIPSIAFSCYDYKKSAYALAAPHLIKFVRYVLQNSLPQGTLLNVNFPSQALPIKGIKLAKQGKSYWIENPEERIHPSEGHIYYWLGSRFIELNESEESDVYLLSQGYITAVPLQLAELTNQLYLQSHRTIFEQQVNCNQ